MRGLGPLSPAGCGGWNGLIEGALAVGRHQHQHGRTRIGGRFGAGAVNGVGPMGTTPVRGQVADVGMGDSRVVVCRPEGVSLWRA